MLKWISLHTNQGVFRGQQIISKENMKRITRAMIFVDEESNGDQNYYGLGWGRTEYSPYPIIAHDGATFGAYAFAAFIPEEKLGIVILSNLRAPQIPALAGQFFDQYFDKPDQNRIQRIDQMEEKQSHPKISNPYPAMALSNYEGIYINPVYGKILVRKKNKDLELQIGQKNLSLTLTHWDRDIFILKWPIVDETESKIIFIPDDTEKISKVKIEYFVREGSGDFEKTQ